MLKPPAGLNQLGKDDLVLLLETMVHIRRFEEKIIEIYPEQEMKTPVHLYIGQEAIAAAVCKSLKKEDYIVTTHRGHGPCIAKGSDPKTLYAEFYGRIDGCCKGKGGSMHPVDPENGILGTSAIVGGGIPHAVGTALASSIRGDGRVSVGFFGDGSTEEGTFHESLNFAALKQLPVVFICENNFYATNSPLTQRQPALNISKKGAGYGIPAVTVDGNDVLAVYEAAKEAIDRARSGEGPSLVECKTYRWKGHVGPDCDYLHGCRPQSELEEWMVKCPIALFKDFLVKSNLISETDYEEIVKKFDSELDIAIKSAKQSALPSKEELFNDVYFTGN